MKKDKIYPYMINHKGDRKAFFKATKEERLAWNEYAVRAVKTFDANPALDSYDSHAVFPGIDRDGKHGPWIPPIWFPEWLEARRATETASKSKSKG